MTILYKANETDFTHFGLGPLNDAVSILVTEERNGIFELEMKYPVSGGRFEDLKNDRIIKADAGHNLKDQRFKIIRITKPLKGIVTVHAEHISYLSQDLALKPKVTFSGNAQQALNTWKANLIDDNPFIVSSDITTTGSGTWTIDEVENPRRALGGVSGSILDKYGGEYRFDNYQIRLMRQRGVNSAALIAYGRNLTELTQEEEIANTYTSVYPYAVYNDDNNKQILVTLPEYYIDSEYVSNFARRKILAVDFSEKEIKTVVALRSAANSYITANDIGVPKVNLKLKFIDLSKTLDYQSLSIIEEVNLCDNVPVYFEEFGINTTAKVIKVVWDDIQKHYQSIEIGEARSSLSQSITATVDGRVADVEKKVNIIQVQADGMKLIYRQVDRPPNGTNVGDLWYQPNGIYEIMYQWDGSDWKEILNTQDLDAIKREVEAAQAEAEAAKQAAEQSFTNAVAEAERLVVEQTEAFDAKFETETVAIRNEIEQGVTNAITNANTYTDEQLLAFDTEFDTVTGAIRTEIEQGYTDAVTEAERLVAEQSEAFDSQMTDVSQEISAVKTNIDTSISNINQEITNNFTSLSDSMSYVNTIADQAKTDAQTGITNAATALSQANSAIGDAQVAQQNALTALGKADNALDGVSNLDVRVDDVEAEIALKADNTFVTEDGVLTTLSNAITFNATRFSSDMQRIESRVESLAGEINLVILKDAFENKGLLGNEVYPNATASVGSDTMREMINVVAGERLALSKDPMTGNNTWRISYYNNGTYVSRIQGENNQYVLTVPAGVNKMWVSYPRGCRLQIVRGSTYVPYRPNMADQMTTDEMVLFRNEYDEFADKTVRRLTSIDSSGGRLETAELLLTQTANGLALKADTTTVNTLTGRLSTAEGQITAQAGQIALRVTETQAKSMVDTAVDGLELGGRNYVTKKSAFTEVINNYQFLPRDTSTPNGFRVVGNTSSTGIVRLLKVITGNGWWTVSFDIKGNQSLSVGLNVDICDSVITRVHTNSTNTYERRSVSAYVTNYSAGVYNFVDFGAIQYANFWIDNIKVEKGNKATDWTEAQEDTMQLISAVSSELKIEKDNITSLLTRTSNNETAITQVKSTADGTKTTVANHAGRLTTVETNVNGLQTTVASKASQTQVTQLSNSLTSVVTNLGSLGGTNLLEGSNGSVESNLGYWYISGGAKWLRSYHRFYKNSTEAVFALSTTGTNEVTASSSTRVYVEPNTTYTFHMLGFMNVNVTSVDVHFLMRRKGETSSFTITMASTSHRLSGSMLDSLTWTFTTPDISDLESGYIRIDNNGSVTQGQSATLYITNLKLEKGAVATDYSESFTEKASQSQITQLSDRINLRVEKGDVVSQINIEANRTLISSGKIYLDGDTYIMGTTFANDIKAKSLEAVNADIANLRTKILTADVITATHLKVDNALIDTLTATTAIVDRFYSKAAVINNLTARTLTAITANITSIRSQVLVADVITSTHLKVDNALIDKLTVNTAVVDRFFSKTAVIDNLSVKTLAAITANITSIRSQVLVADAVTSTHLKSDVALINKLFATTALINELTSKTAFINNIKAIDISADRVTAGTLNAANVNIINLNVSSIVGLNSTFVQSAWNGINTRISIDATSLTASDSSGNQAIINSSGEIRSTAGGTDQTRGILHKGRLWFHTTSGSAVLNIGAHPVVGEGVNRGSIATARAEKLVIGRYNDYLNTNPNAQVNPYITLEYSATLGDESNAFTKVWHNLSMSSKHINDVQQVSGYELAVRSTHGRLMLGVTGYNTLQVGEANTRSYGNMEMMPGYSVTGTSDERLKNSITPTLISGLGVINALEYYDYYWNDRPEIGKQFGLIAQRSPFVSEQNGTSGYWGINMNKLSLVTAKAVKEVDIKVSRIDTYVTQHELEIKNLKRRIQQLEEKLA